MSKFINIHGKLMDLSTPKVMGIVNVTPDSFYKSSRLSTPNSVKTRVLQMLEEGADMIDVGAYSTRPGSELVSPDEEMSRLRMAFDAIGDIAPDAVLSVDTFRSDVAKMSVEEYGVSIVNDVSGGIDPKMFSTASSLGVPYILTYSDWSKHLSNVINSMEYNPEKMSRSFSEKIQLLRDLGQKDIILDPGFGFGKSVINDYSLARDIERLKLHDLPILVGVSRKKMIHLTLETTADDSLTGTTALHTYFLLKGCANILRVHDVKACRDVIRITEKLIHSQ